MKKRVAINTTMIIAIDRLNLAYWYRSGLGWAGLGHDPFDHHLRTYKKNFNQSPDWTVGIRLCLCFGLAVLIFLLSFFVLLH